MRYLDYQICTRQRVSAGRRAEVGNVRKAHGILPGGVVRGALASAWLADHALRKANDEFVDVFERSILFRQALPCGDGQPTFSPVSYVTCKYPDPEQRCTDHWRDRALAALTDREVTDRCPTCGRPGKSGRGWQVPANARARSTRTTLTGDETAEDDKLFTREALSSGLTLRGHLCVLDDDLDIDWFCQPRTLRLGGQRSVLGAATWQANAREATPRPPVPPTGEQAAVLRLRSPAILVDEYGAPTTSVSAALTEALGHDITVAAAWVRPDTAEGWHMASGLPKPHDVVVIAGSSWVVHGLSSDDRAGLALGIGLRRTEGFGEGEVLDATALQEQLDEANNVTAGPPAPDSKASDNRDVFAPLTRLDPGELKRALNAVRDVATYREHRFPQARISEVIQAHLAQPWIAGLPKAERDAISATLNDPDLRGRIAHIQSLLTNQGTR